MIPEIILYLDLKSGEFGRGSALNDLRHLIIFRDRPVLIFPIRIISVAAGRIIPFININGVGAERFYFILDIMLQAVYYNQYADNAENTERNSQQRKKSAEFILPQFQQ